jgi:hypothetical protein
VHPDRRRQMAWIIIITFAVGTVFAALAPILFT